MATFVHVTGDDGGLLKKVKEEQAAARWRMLEAKRQQSLATDAAQQRQMTDASSQKSLPPRGHARPLTAHRHGVKEDLFYAPFAAWRYVGTKSQVGGVYSEYLGVEVTSSDCTQVASASFNAPTANFSTFTTQQPTSSNPCNLPFPYLGRFTETGNDGCTFDVYTGSDYTNKRSMQIRRNIAIPDGSKGMYAVFVQDTFGQNFYDTVTRRRQGHRTVVQAPGVTPVSYGVGTDKSEVLIGRQEDLFHSRSILVFHVTDTTAKVVATPPKLTAAVDRLLPPIWAPDRTISVQTSIGTYGEPYLVAGTYPYFTQDVSTTFGTRTYLDGWLAAPNASSYAMQAPGYYDSRHALLQGFNVPMINRNGFSPSVFYYLNQYPGNISASTTNFQSPAYVAANYPVDKSKLLIRPQGSIVGSSLRVWYQHAEYTATYAETALPPKPVYRASTPGGFERTVKLPPGTGWAVLHAWDATVSDYCKTEVKALGLTP